MDLEKPQKAPRTPRVPLEKILLPVKDVPRANAILPPR